MLHFPFRSLDSLARRADHFAGVRAAEELTAGVAWHWRDLEEMTAAERLEAWRAYLAGDESPRALGSRGPRVEITDVAAWRTWDPDGDLAAAAHQGASSRDAVPPTDPNQGAAE